MENQVVIWATDERFKNIYTGQKGLVIGRGKLKEYERDKALDNFSGKKIGCNTAYKTTELDALIWLDLPFFPNHYDEIRNLNCLKFAVNPFHYFHHGVEIFGLRATRPERCSESFDSGFYPCELSGYIALNMALLFGLDPIWLYGFSSDMANQGIIRSDKFIYIADWAKKHDRKIYLTDKESYLKKFFPYKALPRVKKTKKKKESISVNLIASKIETICIVGHGPNVKGASLGKVIDSHDIVIRMANCDWQENTTDYGHKYDFGIYTPNQQKFVDKTTRFPKLAFWCYIPESNTEEYQTKIRGKDTVCFGDIVESWRGVNRFFSRGLASLIIAAEKVRPKKITLIGFNQVQEGNAGDGPRHPEELQKLMVSKKKDTHDWSNEKQIVDRIKGHYGTEIEFLP